MTDWYETKRLQCLKDIEEKLEQRGMKSRELQWKWRTQLAVPYNQEEAEDAILDALNHEGIVAWSGDGISCVEQMLQLPYSKIKKLNSDIESLEEELYNIRKEFDSVEDELYETQKELSRIKEKLETQKS